MLLETINKITGIAKQKSTPIKIIGRDRVVSFNYMVHIDNGFFKSTCGNFFCTAVGYSAVWLNNGWDKVKNQLCNLELSYQEAEDAIRKSKGIEVIYLYHCRGRERYNNSMRKLLGYGDWSIVTNDEMNDIIGYYSCLPIKKCREYAVRLIRDESGIPSSLYISTVDGKFIGQINTELTSSKNMISFSSDIDQSPWNSRWIGTQSEKIAANISTLAMANSIPVGVIHSSGSEPLFTQKPTSLLLILEHDEKPDRIINFVDSNPPAFVHRLPLGNDTIFHTHILKAPEKHCKTLEKDIIDYSTKHGGIDFISNIMLSSHNVCPAIRSKLLDEYARVSGIHISVLNKAKETSGSESTISTCGKKVLFRSGGRYFATSQKKGIKDYVVSNFAFLPEIEHIHQSGNTIEGTLLCEKHRAKIFIDVNKVFKFKEFLSIIADKCAEISAPLPVIQQREDIQLVRKLILEGIATSIKKPKFLVGLNQQNTDYTTAWCRINRHGISYNAYNIGGQIDSMLYTPHAVSYSQRVKSRLREWSETCPQSAKAVFIFLRALRSGFNGKPSAVLMSENSAKILTSVLGIEKIDKAIPRAIGYIPYPVIKNDIINTGGLVHICHDAQFIEKGSWSFTGDADLQEAPEGPPVLAALLSEFLSTGVYGAMDYAYGKKHGYSHIEDSKLEVREATTLRDFLDALRGLGVEDDVVKVFDNGSMEINLSLSSALLKKNGIKFNRKKVLLDLQSHGSLMAYPIRKYKTRSTCALVHINAFSYP